MMIKSGDLVILEDGQYSDREWHGPFRATKDLNIREAAEEFKSMFKPKDEYDHPDPAKFIAWLSGERGYLEQVEAETVHVGSYGRIEIDA